MLKHLRCHYPAVLRFSLSKQRGQPTPKRTCPKFPAGNLTVAEFNSSRPAPGVPHGDLKRAKAIDKENSVKPAHSDNPAHEQHRNDPKRPKCC